MSDLTKIQTSRLNTEEVMLNSGNQDIAGNKNFTGALTLNGNNVATTNNTVILTGNQTVSGEKTFIHPTRFKGARPQYIHSTNIDLTVTPTSTMSTYIDFLDKNDERIGVFGVNKQSNGSTGMYLQIGNEGSIALRKDADGNVYTYCPTPSSTTDNSTKIATTAWVTSKLSNDSGVVHTTGNESISGVKTFNGSNPIVLQNNSGKNTTLTLKDSTTAYGTSAVDFVQATSNNINQLLVHFQEGNKWCTSWEQNPTSKNISLRFTGCEAVYAPTPTANSNDTNIATTAWCTNASINGNLFGVPNYSGVVTWTGTGTKTASTNGILHIYRSGQSCNITGTINGKVNITIGRNGTGYWDDVSSQFLMKQGDYFNITSRNGSGVTVYFIPCL